MTRHTREFTFDERGFPSLTKKWKFDVPELGDIEYTATGRRARGELERMTDYWFKRWLTGQVPEEIASDHCTAEWLARRCTDIDNRPTSTGAVRAIMDRWVEIGYADMVRDTTRTRLVGLTEQGMKIGYDEIVRQAKRRARTRHYDWDKGKK